MERVDLAVLDGSESHEATVEVALVNGSTTVVLTFADRGVRATGFDVLECLFAVRRELEADGLLLCCQGARPNVWASGMARDMSGGRKAYDLREGKVPTMEDVIDVLEPAPCTDVATIDEQCVRVSELLAKRTGNDQAETLAILRRASGQQ